MFTTFPGSNHFNFFFRKGLDLSEQIGNVFRLYLLQLIPIQSRYHQEVAKIDLLCISFTQRFRGRITSIFFCWKALDLYFECPPKFWSLSATINLNLESISSGSFFWFLFFCCFFLQNFQKLYNFCFNSCYFLAFCKNTDTYLCCVETLSIMK